MSQANQKDTGPVDRPHMRISPSPQAESQEEPHAVSEMIAREQRLRHALEERVKELNCLYSIAEAVDRSAGSLDELLSDIVGVLPESWQYPKITCARIVFEEREYTSNGFQRSAWRQAAGIRASGEDVGVVEVYYLTEMPTIDEGPFLKEERLLINAVAERTGKIIDRLRATQQLEIERNALQESNIAMRQLMGRIREEKAEIGAAVQSNVDKIILPIVDALDQSASAQQSRYLSLLRRNLEEIASPFADRLSRAFLSLTPMEIRICNMVRRNLTTKQIARLQGISPATVSHHREHIRRKLKLTSANVNLATYLHARMSQWEDIPETSGV